MVGLCGVQRLEMQAVEKHTHAAASICRHVFFQRRPGKIAEALIVQLGPGRANDLKVGPQQPIGMQRAQRRQQHALR